MKHTIVVTGGAGFIGRNAVEVLNKKGYDNVLIVDALGTDEKWRNLRGLQYEDIVSPSQFLDLVERNALPKLDGIVHLGACSATTERDADFLLENNYRYTRVLCEWSLANKVRFIYASSAATYGEGAQGYSDSDVATPTLRPLNMYGYSKHMFDLWALRHKLFDRIVGLKYFNVFGPYEDHKDDMRSVVSKSFFQIQREGKINLFKSYRPDYADGEQKRDFIYVKDAVDVTLSFLDDLQGGGLFNWARRSSRPWTSRSTSTLSRCPKSCAASISTLPRPRWPSCARRVTPSHLPRSKMPSRTTSRPTT